MKKSTAIAKLIPLLFLLLLSCEDDLLLHEKEILVESQEAPMLKSANTSGYIMDLIPMVNELAENGYLNKGNSNMLVIKVRNAIAQLEKNNKNAATAQLKTFISQVTNLKEKGSIPAVAAEAIINKAGNGLILIKGSFLDIRDGSKYKVVLMGDKIWMAENLKYLPYLSTMPADYAPDQEILNTENPGGMYYVYQYWGSSVEEAKMTYAYKTSGVLYTHIAAVGGGSSSWQKTASPAGWHVASSEEWDQLAQYVSSKKGPYTRTGGYIDIIDGYYDNYIFLNWENVGIHLKSTNGWYANNGSDDFGFSAYPNGIISPKYNDFNQDNVPKWSAAWWTSTPMPPGANDGPVFIHLNYEDHNLRNAAYYFSAVGLAVRCVKD
jgi:uncharacterized protein (TIGR02145 family)